MSETNASLLEGKITYKELANSLNQMKNNKSPGLDRFSVEFFKFFWPNLKYFILRSKNELVDNGNLSISQRRGVITCLPKRDKSRFDFNNEIFQDASSPEPYNLFDNNGVAISSGFHDILQYQACRGE